MQYIYYCTNGMKHIMDALDDYTKDYGKVDAILPLPEDRYAIFTVHEKWNDSHKYYTHTYEFMLQIDNYGHMEGTIQDFILHKQSFSNNSIGRWKYHCAKYPFPNCLIDVIKTIQIPSTDDATLDSFSYMMSKNVPLIKKICKLSDHYYKRFTKYEPFYKSDGFVKYDELVDLNIQRLKEIDELKKLELEKTKEVNELKQRIVKEHKKFVEMCGIELDGSGARVNFVYQKY